jgi:hypothetical protein
MKRRDFLRKLGLGTAVAAVAPVVLSKPENYEALQHGPAGITLANGPDGKAMVLRTNGTCAMTRDRDGVWRFNDGF